MNQAVAAETSAIAPLRSIAFVLPFVLGSLNERDHTHWAQRHKNKDQLYYEVLAAIGGSRYLPRPRFNFVRITIVRHGKRALDTDNLYASVKDLVDVLCERNDRRPVAVGICYDDAPAFCELVVKQQPAVDEPVTVVRVEEIEQPLRGTFPVPAKRKPSKPNVAAQIMRRKPGKKKAGAPDMNRLFSG